MAENALTRHAALALRGRGELPGPEVEPERARAAGAADDDREPDQLRASALQRLGARLQQLHRDLPERPHRRPVRLHAARLLRRRAAGLAGARRRPRLRRGRRRGRSSTTAGAARRPAPWSSGPTAPAARLRAATPAATLPAPGRHPPATLRRPPATARPRLRSRPDRAERGVPRDRQGSRRDEQRLA